MKIVDEYHDRLTQATSVEEKKQIAVELHIVAQKFDPIERRDYELAMREKHLQVVATLPDIDAVVNKAQNLINAIEARRSVQV